MAVKRKFLTSRQLRNVLLVLFGRRAGICLALVDLFEAGLISGPQRLRVTDAIYQHRDRAHWWNPSLGGYFFSYQQVEGDELRLALLHKVLDPKPRAKRSAPKKRRVRLYRAR